MPIKLPRMQRAFPLVEGGGLPHRAFHKDWDTAMATIEAALNDILDAQAAAAAADAAAALANAAAAAAAAAAADAQSAADSANTAIVTINDSIADLDSRVTALEP